MIRVSKILVPKQRHLWLNDVEEFRDDLTNAPEMPRPMLAFHRIAELRHIDDDLRQAGLIHFIFIRIENQIDAFKFTLFQIIFDRAGVLCEILARAELGRINKNADRHMLGVLLGVASTSDKCPSCSCFPWSAMAFIRVVRTLSAAHGILWWCVRPSCS